MAEISASTVMKLRKMSGQGMMDCKKALEESDGDMDGAMQILRQKGMATLAKRAGRETSEGIIVGALSEDGKTGVLASLCCETDFVAKSDAFKEVAEKLKEYALACEEDSGTDNVLETQIDGKKFRDLFADLVSKTGEKTEIGDYMKFELEGPGLIQIYIHFNHKTGGMVEVETDSEQTAGSSELAAAANDVAMHVTATNPLALDKDSIDSETIEKEKDIAAEQFKDKPAQVVEKILEGKLKKFYEENCLVNQPFVKDDDKTVEQIITEAAKSAGGEAGIKRFVRFDVS